MLVMLIMHMRVDMRHGLVNVLVLMMFGEM